MPEPTGFTLHEQSLPGHCIQLGPGTPWPTLFWVLGSVVSEFLYRVLGKPSQDRDVLRFPYLF